MSVDGFAFPESIGADVLDVSIVGKNIVIWLELQLDPLSIAL